MKTLAISVSALALTASVSMAAGLDRSGQSIAPMFAESGTFSLSFGSVSPRVTGSDALGNNYDVGESYTSTTLAYTRSLTDQIGFSLIVDEPYGANTLYNNAPNASMLGGTGATLGSRGVNMIGRYQISDRFSVHGGLRVQSINSDVTLNGLAYGVGIGAGVTAAVFNAGGIAGGPGAGEPDLTSELAAGTVSSDVATQNAALAAIDAQYAGNPSADIQTAMVNNRDTFVGNGGYQFEAEKDWSTGYLIGAAYEIPDIALRLAVTYFSEVDHNADTLETNAIAGLNNAAGNVEFVTPSAFNLDFQTGIAADTLLTASYRRANYQDVDVVPTNLGSDLVNLNMAERYTLGVGRRFSDALSGSVTFSFEPEGNDLVSPLGPTNGLRGLSVGARYNMGNGTTVSGGVNYSLLGDAQADVGGSGVADFTDNSVLAFGIQVGMKF